eukprot:2392325-Rhodomonas_salina.5
MINGRRRDHGAERAYIDLFENAPIGGGLAKVTCEHARCLLWLWLWLWLWLEEGGDDERRAAEAANAAVNPLAYWTFEDCFDYITKYKIPIHPLHADGYPSIGDKKDTVKVALPLFSNDRRFPTPTSRAMRAGNAMLLGVVLALTCVRVRCCRCPRTAPSSTSTSSSRATRPSGSTTLRSAPSQPLSSLLFLPLFSSLLSHFPLPSLFPLVPAPLPRAVRCESCAASTCLT